MLKAIRVDVRRILSTGRLMFFVLLVAVIIPIVMEILYIAVGKSLGGPYVATIDDFSSFTAYSTIYLAVFTSFFLYGEFGDGTIRNKIVSGKSRLQILFSYCIVNSLVAIVIQVVSAVSALLVDLVFRVEIGVEFTELLYFIAVSSLAEVAVTVLYTSIIICFCTNKAGVAIPAVIALFMKIALLVIIDALYTDSGIPKVTGAKLSGYTFFDRYISFSHLTGPLRWDIGSYLIGSIALIIISVIVGSVVFSKKNLK